VCITGAKWTGVDVRNTKVTDMLKVLLDIKMPEMNGFHLYQEMKKIDSKVKVCFLTPSEMYYERFRNEEEFSVIDKDLFLQKPIENDDLIKNTIISQGHNNQ